MNEAVRGEAGALRPRSVEEGLDPADSLAGGGRMGALMRETDWAATPLGSVAAWPQSLRTSVSICLGTSFPMMIAWGPDLYMIYNDGYLPVLGTKKHPRALGQPLLECFAEIRDLIGPLFRGVLQSGEPFGANDMMFPLERHGYPEETYFVFSYSPIRDESGRVGGVLTTCTETTERVIGERRLRTLRALAEAAGHASTPEHAFERAARTLDPADTPFALLYLVEPSGESARLVATSGIEVDRPESPGRVDLRDGAPCPWPLRAVASTRAPALVDDLAVRFGPLPGGPWPEPTTQALVLAIARPGTPHPYGFLVAGISPRRALDEAYRDYLELVADHVATAAANARAREEERRRVEALAELDRAKTAFFSNVSHEFRTPLTLMIGPLEDVLAGAHGEPPPAVREQLDLTYRNSLRLLKLVNSLLDFARIEAGRMRARFEPVELAAITADVASAFRSAVERAGLRFTVDCPPLDEPVHVDVELWEKIVLNLLSNALKFTFDGEIAVRIRRRGDHVELEVRDTGTGIPAHELPNLFKRFHRIQGARSRTHEGTGIGLALVQDLLRLHGGDIRCDSEVDRGSRFTATVRLGTAHLPSDQIGAPRTEASSAIRAEAYVEEALRWLPEPPSPSGDARSNGGATPRASETAARVLVVDDNADMRDYLRRILGACWRVDTFADGRLALEAARRDPPDLVLADVMMPFLDGFGLLRELRADERTRRIPLVMLSARAGEEARIEGLRAGADDYLIKPFGARELVARVGSQLALARARRVVEAQRATLDSLFASLPAPVSILRGPDLVYEMVNPYFLEMVHRTPEEVVGRPAFEAFPEVRGQGFEAMLRGVRETGTPFVGREVALRYDFDRDGAEETSYWNFVVAPLPDEDGGRDRVMSFGYEVTDEIRARRRVEAIAAELRRAVAFGDETIAQLDTILASVPVGLAIFDRDVRYVRINTHLADVNGVPVELTVGRTAHEVLPPELAALAQRNVHLVFETRAPIGPFEISAPAPSAPTRERHWLLTYYPVLGRAGEVIHVGVVVVDITVQRDAELERAQLLERERIARREADLQRQHLHSLLMQAPTPICILRGEAYVIDLANEVCCDVWGRRHEDVIGRPLFDAVPEARAFGELLGRTMSTGEIYVGKEVPATLKPGGKPVYFNFVYAPLRDAANRIDGLLIIAFDVTDEILAREEMSRTVRYNEMFAGVLAHDLRNPLGAILTAAQLLIRRSDDEKVAGPACRILSSGERMSRMISQLLDFTRIRVGGGLRLERQAVDVGETTRRVIAEVEESEGRRVEVDVVGDTSGHWDPDRLAQVISNLACNAVQHGDVAGRFRIFVDGRRADHIVMCFENAGAIAEEALQTMFDPFRGQNGKRASKGLGLGLYISREIVAAHGGTMQVSSSPADGTRFTIALPRRGSSPTTRREDSPGHKNGEAAHGGDGLFADRSGPGGGGAPRS